MPKVRSAQIRPCKVRADEKSVLGLCLAKITIGQVSTLNEVEVRKVCHPVRRLDGDIFLR